MKCHAPSATSTCYLRNCLSQRYFLAQGFLPDLTWFIHQTQCFLLLVEITATHNPTGGST